MSRWYVSEQSIFDEETGQEIIEASEWYMRKDLQNICDEHNYYETIKKENEIYRKFITELCNKLLEEVEKDGYCRMIVKKEKVTKLLESLPKQSQEAKS